MLRLFVRELGSVGQQCPAELFQLRIALLLLLGFSLQPALLFRIVQRFSGFENALGLALVLSGLPIMSSKMFDVVEVFSLMFSIQTGQTPWILMYRVRE